MAYNETTWSPDTLSKASETSSATLNNATLSGTLTVTGATALNGGIGTALTLSNTLTVGENDTGYDVKFYGATSGKYLLWDESADKLLTAGSATIDIVKDKLLIGSTAVTTTAAELNILDGVTSTTAELNILDGVTSTTAELNILDGVTSTAAELNILDGVTATASEINLIDGDTSRGTTAVASGDGILINDAGTMRMTNVDTVSTYFSSHNVGGGNIVTTGALNSGSITSGFGAIDNGSSAITTTGTVTFGSITDGTITATAFVDEDDMSSDSATLIPTQQSVKAYVDGQDFAATSFVMEDGDGTEVTITKNKEMKFVEGGGIDINWTDTDNGTDGDPYDLTFAIDSTVATLTGSQTLASKTLTSPILNTGVSGTAIKDEDNMSSNSATHLATQQSIKAYVDAQIATEDTLAELNDTDITSPADGALLIYDTGTSTWRDYAVSGDVTITDGGVAAIGSGVIVNADINGSAAIADSKLATISTADKVAGGAIQIDSGTDGTGITLANTDKLLVDDGGATKYINASQITTFINSNANFASADTATALAIALG